MRRIEKFFDSYGRFVAKNPLPFLIVPLFVTLISALGVLNFHSQDDIWDIYAPLNAISRVEEKQLEKFEYMSAANHYRIQIIVDRKDGGNLMNLENIAELAAVNRMISENLTIEANGRIWRYRDLCGVYCNESNALVLGIIQALVESRRSRADDTTSRLTFTYPTMNAFHSRIFLGYSVGGLTMDSRQNQPVVKEFRLFILHYMLNMRLPQANKIRDDFESQLLAFFQRASAESSQLNYALLSRKRELDEQRKITTTSIPYLFLTGAVLTVFMVVTLIDRPLYKSQFIEAIFGIVSPSMALITTFGVVWAAGYPFSNILTVVPFLVVTIGIDDAFLILAGWRHSNPKEDLVTRMGESVSKSGASVTVTSVTDVLCFGVGILSNMPVVQLFCLYTSIALTIDFLYQITFFLAITVYCGRRQLRIADEIRIQQINKELDSTKDCATLNYDNETVNRLFTTIQSNPGFFAAAAAAANTTAEAADSSTLDHRHAEYTEDDEGSSNVKPEMMDTGTTVSTRSADGGESSAPSNNYGVRMLVDALFTPTVVAAIFGIFAAHIFVSVYCCTLVSTDFDMENLYLRDSPLTPISQKMQHFVLDESFVVNFVLSDFHAAGTFESAERRRLFEEMVERLERIPRFGMGDSRGTNLWLRDYEMAVSFWVGEDESSVWEPAEMLRNYRSLHMDEKFIHTKRNEKGEEVIDSFSWYITYHNMASFLDVEQLMEGRRNILAEYAALFTVHSHHPLEKVPTESAMSAPINFVQTATSAIVLMSMLVFFCIWNVEAIFCVVLSILSISVGTVGYLHLWNVNLDAVSLISMLMSIGFSVDYSAHICYHFYTHATAESGDGDDLKKQRLNKVYPIAVSPITTFNAVKPPLSAASSTRSGTGSSGDSGASETGIKQRPTTNTTVTTSGATSPPSLFTHSISHSSTTVTTIVGKSSECAVITNANRTPTQLPHSIANAEIYRRLVCTFNGVGWPVVQSGVSTVLGMIPLFFVDAYVVDVFWKTIILVTVLGMFHALLLLPILFISIAAMRRWFWTVRYTCSYDLSGGKKFSTKERQRQQSSCKRPTNMLMPITLQIDA